MTRLPKKYLTINVKMCRNITTKSSKSKKKIISVTKVNWYGIPLRRPARQNPCRENMLAQSKTDVNLMYTNFAEMSGMTLDELLESFGMDEDGVSEIAEDSVIDVMIAKSIMAKENLTMDDTTYKNKLWTALGYEDGDDEKVFPIWKKSTKKAREAIRKTI